MANCPHQRDLEKLQPPKLSQFVHREECTRCFDNQDCETGVDVCLVCFNGACVDQEKRHALIHVRRSGHSFTLNVKRRSKAQLSSRDDYEPPTKMTKLAVVEQREEDDWEHHTTLKCWLCDPCNGKEIAARTDLINQLRTGVMQSLSSARQAEVKAWEEEITACEHTLILEQCATGSIPAEGLACCASCALTSNLWLCLTCGALGCGRAQYGGTGGNGHALRHYETTQHPACVKLGTITPEGGADIYCYACNDARLDPELAMHLATFGINVSSQMKTEKSMTELQIEQNLTFDFSLTAEDGSALRPVFGPGLTGICNLGNSCYMASVLQALFSLPQFRQRYHGNGGRPNCVSERAFAHWESCKHPLPADCLECQMLKLADGLLSGRYSRPHTEPAPCDALAHPKPEHSPWQAGLKPAGFKALVGKGHAEFATMRQQDAEEFFGHLLTVLRRFNHQVSSSALDSIGFEATEAFAFGLEQRLQCLSCGKVRYRVDNMDVLSVGVPAQQVSECRPEPGNSPSVTPSNTKSDAEIQYAPVALLGCLNLLLGDGGQEELEYQCEGGCGKVLAVRHLRFASFPDVLVLRITKFQLKNWVPAKLDVPIILPKGDQLELDLYMGRGLQPGEEELPRTSPGSLPNSPPQFDPEVLDQLQGMGFPLVRCQKALLSTGPDVESAMDWLLAYKDDPDIDDPIQSPDIGYASELSDDQIQVLAEMGFTHAQAKRALLETEGNPERAVEWLFSHSVDTMETAPLPGEDAPKTLPGSPRLPAQYRLKAFISHKGPSVHSGHYVAHIRVPGLLANYDMNAEDSEEWVLFNDEKVVVADKTSVEELKKQAYMYIFERV